MTARTLARPAASPARLTAQPAGRVRSALRDPVVTLPLVLSALAWFAVWILMNPAIRFDPAALAAMAWSAMVLAMMVPLALPHVSVFCTRLYRHQRLPAMLSVNGGYILVWVLAGAALVPLVVVGRSVGGLVPVLAWGAALGWTLAVTRAQLLRRCHAVPVAYGQGPRLYRSAFGYGLRLGGLCFAACFPAMAAAMVSGQGPAAMFLLTHVLLTERLSPRPSPRATASALALVAATALIA